MPTPVATATSAAAATQSPQRLEWQSDRGDAVLTLRAQGTERAVDLAGGATLTKKTDWSLGYEQSVPAGSPEGPSNYVHADQHAIAFNHAHHHAGQRAERDQAADRARPAHW